MDASRSKVKGMVSEIGLERDDEHFRSFNLKISVVIKPLKILDYDEAERLMRQFRKDLLGREVELTSTIFRCPTCGREFKNERGLNKHLKTVHKVKKAEKNRETPLRRVDQRRLKRGKTPAKHEGEPPIQTSASLWMTVGCWSIGSSLAQHLRLPSSTLF